MKQFLFATFVVLMLLPLISESGADSVLYGPEVFDRTQGAPNVYDVTFSAIPGSAYLVVYNGDEEQDSRVSSAGLVLNGTQVVTQSEFNQQVEKISKSITVLANNKIQITLDGAPGSYITVLILTNSAVPEFTYGRLHLAWTSIADPARSVTLRLKNGSPGYHRCYKIRFYNEDGTLAAVSEKQELAKHAGLNAAVQSFLPEGSTWQSGSLEILFAGRGGGRVLGFGIEADGSNQTETVVPLQWGGIRHVLPKAKK